MIYIYEIYLAFEMGKSFVNSKWANHLIFRNSRDFVLRNWKKIWLSLLQEIKGLNISEGLYIFCEECKNNKLSSGEIQI